MSVILLYFYIFAIAFVEISGTTIAVRVFFALAGLILNILHFNRQMFIIFLINLPVIIYSFFIALINGTGDNSFTFALLKSFAYFFAAYFIIYLIQRKYKFACNKLLHCLFEAYFYATMIQLFLGFLIFLFPSLLDFFNSFIYAVNIEKITAYSRFRLVLPGETNFFGAGIICCNSMLIWAFLVKGKYWTFNSINLLKLFYVFLLGVLVARTVLVGAVLCLLYLVPQIMDVIKLRSILTILFAICLFIPLIHEFMPDDLLCFGFEHFYSMSENGSFESQSTNTLMEMWQVFPHDMRTLLFGDGRWVSNDGYYMETDVGYLRLIFYFGVLGAALFFISQILQYYYIKQWFKDKEIRRFIFFTLISFFVYNIKGFTTIVAAGGLLSLLGAIMAFAPNQDIDSNNL